MVNLQNMFRIFNMTQSWLVVYVVLVSVELALGLGRHSDELSITAISTMVTITLPINTVYSTSTLILQIK